MEYNIKRKCRRCGELVEYHKKCSECEILLHEEKEEYKSGGIQHTLEVKKGKCRSCSRR